MDHDIYIYKWFFVHIVFRHHHSRMFLHDFQTNPFLSNPLVLGHWQDWSVSQLASPREAGGLQDWQIGPKSNCWPLTQTICWKQWWPSCRCLFIFWAPTPPVVVVFLETANGLKLALSLICQSCAVLKCWFLRLKLKGQSNFFDFLLDVAIPFSTENPHEKSIWSSFWLISFRALAWHLTGQRDDTTHGPGAGSWIDIARRFFGDTFPVWNRYDSTINVCS